jgi:hypothetical protein
MAKTNIEFQSDEPQQQGFRCDICLEWHDALPWSYSVKVPLAAARIPDEELDRRVVFTLDQCVVDGLDFFLRGRIPVPVHGHDQPFIWGVWAKVSSRDFVRTNDLWKANGRESEPAYSGWLDTNIPLYGDTCNLELRVRTQPVGRRPHFEMVDAAHPLSVEQREGVSVQRVQEIAQEFLHPKVDRKS